MFSTLVCACMGQSSYTLVCSWVKVHILCIYKCIQITKMDRSCRKMEESLVKAAREYRDSNTKTEETRLSWESAMYKCCNVSQSGFTIRMIL